MRRLLPLTLLAAAALTLTPLTAQTYRIAGTIFSAADNHPLQRASIQITNVNNLQQIQTTTSDEYGHFAFTGVSKGLFELQGKATGYLPTLYDEHGGFNTGIVTGAGVDTESLTLKVLPESSISGIVVNEAAEPVEHAIVRLYREDHASLDGRISHAGAASTDDLGHFELAHLKPGTYFIAVTAAPWYAVYPPLPQEANTNPSPQQSRANNQRQQQQKQAPASGFADSIDPTLDVAYSTDFYPGTTDSAHAQPLTLRGGDSRELHFQLSPQPALTVVIPRAPAKPGQPDSGAPPQLRMSIFGQLEPTLQSEMRMSPTQTVIAGLSPGDYILSDARTPGNLANSGIPLHLADRVTQAAPDTAPSASGLTHVRIILHSAEGKTSSNLWVSLLQPHSTQTVASQANDRGQVDLNVPPGDYYFHIEDRGKVLFPRQILSGEQPVPGGNIHLTADSSRYFTITYSEGTHILKGFARKDGKGFPGAFILLFPTGETASPHTFFRQQSDLDGSFSIDGIAPGAYTLLAIENGWDLDWQQNKALAPFLAKAQSIQIPDTPEKTHYLTAVLPVQPR